MTTVTKKIKSLNAETIKSILGKDIAKKFVINSFDDGRALNTEENVSPATMGTIVDNLTRACKGKWGTIAAYDNINEITDEVIHDIEIIVVQCDLYGISQLDSSFGPYSPAIMGAYNMDLGTFKTTHLCKASKCAYTILHECLLIGGNPNNLSSDAIESACILASYEAVYRAGKIAYKEATLPDADTINNIKIMTERGCDFFKGKKINKYVNRLEYDNLIGDIDYLTEDAIWDFKVSKYDPHKKNEYILQQVIYYYMGSKSDKKTFKDIKSIGFFNPRLNKSYELKIETLPSNWMSELEKVL